MSRIIDLRQPGTVRPKTEYNIEYDRERIVLARCSLKELWWMRAGKCWAGRGQPRASLKACLELADYSLLTGIPRCITLHEGGRLSYGLILKYDGKIADFLGIDLDDVRDIRPGFTAFFEYQENAKAST
jgi:hypothetical protein